MNHIEPIKRILKGIGLVELEWKVLLRLDVHPNNLEPGPVVSHCRPAGTAEQVKQAHFPIHPRFPG
jgi:hypothetical protein